MPTLTALAAAFASKAALLATLAAPAPEGDAPLPLRRVVLYKHGLGYFEREGKVSGDATLELAFKAGEMNDVLKSLTLLDLSGRGRVSSVAYDSTRPLDRLLADYPFDLRTGGGTKGLTGLLPQLQGASLEVKLPSGVVTGLVLGVDTVSRKEGDTSFTTTVLSLLTPEGAMRKIDLAEVISLEPTDPRLKKDLGEYLGILNASRRKDEKRLTIQASGEGERSLFASYTVEAPVWKASYRAILPEKGGANGGGEGAERDRGKPLIQGWALVDNTSDEDWTDVELSLVSGRPVSFVLNLYDPRYKRRPVVEIEEEIAATPQTHEGAIEAKEKAGAAPATAGVPPGSPPVADKRVARLRHAAASESPEELEMEDAVASREMFVGSLESQSPDAVAREIGDLFQYVIDHRVTIPKNRSALIPILSSRVEGERVDVYNEAARSRNPLNALRFKNTSGLTLEGGPVTILEGATYAGEAILETLKPNETRFLSYAVDLAVKISTTFDSSEDAVTLVQILHGSLVAHRRLVQTRTYTIRNDASEPKTVWIEHHRRGDWTIRDGAEKPEESTESYHRFKVLVAEESTAKFPVVEWYPQETRYDITNLDRDTLDVFLAQRLLSPEMQAALEKTLSIRGEIASLDALVQRLGAEKKSLFDNQARLRQNLQALKGTAEESSLRSRYIQQMQKEEDRVNAIDEELGKHAARRGALQTELDTMIRTLALEFKVK